MTLQTIFYDADGWVLSVDKADSPATVHGAQKATADTNTVGEVTLNHKVTVSDGVVTGTEYIPPSESPEPPVTYTPYEFWQRFTKAERKDIRNAAKQDDDLEDWLDMLRVAGSVVVVDPNTVGGMQALVDAGLLTAARRDEILG